jgi:hypothetical protein
MRSPLPSYGLQIPGASTVWMMLRWSLELRWIVRAGTSWPLRSRKNSAQMFEPRPEARDPQVLCDEMNHAAIMAILPNIFRT